MAADIGRKLGTGAYLLELRRLSSGRFSVAHGIPGKVLKEPGAQQELLAGMLPVDHALTMLENEQEMADTNDQLADS